jgi:hypothetical protein
MCVAKWFDDELYRGIVVDVTEAKDDVNNDNDDDNQDSKMACSFGLNIKTAMKKISTNPN